MHIAETLVNIQLGEILDAIELQDKLRDKEEWVLVLNYHELRIL